MTGRQRPKNGGGTGASTRSGTGWQAVAFAIFAAALYAVSTPVSKLLLRTTGPAMLAALLYLGAGIGMGAVGLIKKKTPVPPASRFVWGDVPFLVLMVVLDIAAPILMMLGLKTTGAASASLLNNAEIVATSLIALCLFGERIRPRLWVGIALVTAASCLLSFDGTASLAFSAGSLYVLSACLCWGLENNCTRRLSGRDPLKIVVVKGIFFRPWRVGGGLDRRGSVPRRGAAACGARARVCGLRAQHLFLHPRAAGSRRRAHKRLLCVRPVSGDCAFVSVLPRRARVDLFCSVAADARGRVSGSAGAGAGWQT